MKKTVSTVIAGALLTGLLAGSIANANEHEGDAAHKHEKNKCKGKHKDSCKGKKKAKNGCSGKDGCSGKNEEHKDHE